MKTIEQNLKYIADFVGADYEELLSAYLLIKEKGSLDARDIRFFSEKGVPIIQQLASVHKMPNTEYINAMTTKSDGCETKPYSESVKNLKTALKNLACYWEIESYCKKEVECRILPKLKNRGK